MLSLLPFPKRCARALSFPMTRLCSCDLFADKHSRLHPALHVMLKHLGGHALPSRSISAASLVLSAHNSQSKALSHSAAAPGCTGVAALPGSGRPSQQDLDVPSQPAPQTLDAPCPKEAACSPRAAACQAASSPSTPRSVPFKMGEGFGVLGTLLDQAEPCQATGTSPLPDGACARPLAGGVQVREWVPRGMWLHGCACGAPS